MAFVSRGFFWDRYTRNPASRSLLFTDLGCRFIPSSPTKAAIFLQDSLLFRRASFTIFLSALGVVFLFLPQFPALLEPKCILFSSFFLITHTLCGDTCSFLAISLCFMEVSCSRTLICPTFLGLKSFFLPILLVPYVTTPKHRSVQNRELYDIINIEYH